MIQTIATLSLIILSFFNSQAQAKELTLLGERPSTCKNLESDDSIVKFDSQFTAQVQSLLENDRLNVAVVPSPDCFRVGTEVQLYLTNETIPFLGRGLIQKINVVSGSELLKTKTPYSKASISSFLKANKTSRYGIITLKVTEKIQETVVKEEYQRLPTCFPAYGDWESLRVKESQKSVVAEIQKKQRKALMWNGTFNCYKVGLYTEILIAKERNEESLGYVIPTELHLVHYSNLSQSHANILGESLSDLKQRLDKNKDLDGGYVTMVVFEYESKHPKDSE